jgi:hypothetical protein
MVVLTCADEEVRAVEGISGHRNAPVFRDPAYASLRSCWLRVNPRSGAGGSEIATRAGPYFASS